MHWVSILRHLRRPHHIMCLQHYLGIHIQCYKLCTTIVGVLDVAETTDEHWKAVSLFSSFYSYYSNDAGDSCFIFWCLQCWLPCSGVNRTHCFSQKPSKDSLMLWWAIATTVNVNKVTAFQGGTWVQVYRRMHAPTELWVWLNFTSPKMHGMVLYDHLLTTVHEWILGSCICDCVFRVQIPFWDIESDQHPRNGESSPEQEKIGLLLYSWTMNRFVSYEYWYL